MEGRLMSNWPNTNDKSLKLPFQTNTQKIMSEWQQHMGHDVPIRVCGPCGRKIFMINEDATMLPITHELLQYCKAKQTELPPENSLRYAALHLVKHGKNIFRLTEEGIENDKVIICQTCHTNLKYAKRTKKPPINTFAHYDIGKIPSHLKKLTFGEKLAISKTIAFIPQIQFKPVFGKSNKGIKGHAFCIRTSQNQIISSIVNKLPRHDLAEVIQVLLHGKKNTWSIAKKLIQQGPLNIRIDVIIPWLIWLKEIKNPEFINVTIPDAKDTKEIQQIQMMLQNSVKQLLENAVTTDSGHVDRMSQHIRSNTLDELDGLNQNLDTSIIRNILISTEPQSKEPMHDILQNIKNKLNQEAKNNTADSELKKVIENELLNEYTENHKIISCSFPYIFPLGIKDAITSTVTFTKQLRETWLLFYDQRCAEETNLIFLLFDQIRRHKANSSVAFKIKSAGVKEKHFINQVNEPNFKKSIDEAVKNPNTADARRLKNILEPLVKITGQTISWSVYEREQTLNKLYALSYFFGIGTHFITLSPSMRNNILALRFSILDYKKKFQLPNITIRSKMMIQNPVAATHVFYRLLHKIFEIIIQAPLTDYTGKTSDIKKLLHRSQQKETGAFGAIKAAYGVLEEQASGNLHYHGILFGAWDIKHIQQWLHDPNFKKEFEKLIDSHITCTIPNHLKKQHPTNTINLQTPYPNSENIGRNAAIFAARYNNHKHSHTCWKNKNNKCRLAMKQPLAKQTMFREIEENINKQPKLKNKNGKITEPPKRNTAEDTFSVNDERIIVLNLARQDPFEQMQVEFNEITTACIRCNTSTQVLVTASQGKAAMYYCAKYMSKPPYQLQNVLTLFAQAEEEYKKYGSKATDHGTNTRKAKNILQKILNKSGLMEISDQQATAATMGYPSALSTHKFCFIHPWQAVYHHHKLCNNTQTTTNNFDDILSDLEIETNTGKAISITQYELYLARGNSLRLLNQYDYCLHIGKIKKRKNNYRTYKPGRKTNKTFAFEKNSKPSKCFTQIIKSCPEIPRLTGPAPPKYPGTKPSPQTSTKEKIHWNAEAKIFTEFYSLLFFPTKVDGSLIQPYNDILPWKGISSWDKFWKILNSFKESTSLYKKSIWFIFQNMVDNLRQSAKERTLVTKWRFLEADTRNHNHDQLDKTRTISQKKSSKTIDDDDIVAICETLRAKHGADEFLSLKEIEIKKSNKYLDRQINIYRKLQKKDIRIIPKKKFPTFSITECQKMVGKQQIILNQQNKIMKSTNTYSNDAADFILRINPSNNIKLNPHQERAVEQLKQIKTDNLGHNNTKPYQLLAILQGAPGSGKTVTATQVAKKLGLRTLFSGTTSTAAAQLNAETINTLLGLGLNTNNFTNKNIPYQTKQNIIQKFQDIDLLVIDEISMLTPVTLCRIEYQLRTSLENEYLFGGLDILLIGDMWQFPPVAPGLPKPALYQGAVMLGLGLRMPNEAYRIGASIFTQFTLVTLDGQERTSREYNNWLKQVRNPNIEYPITDEWLSKIKILSAEDFSDDAINWTTTGIIVSGNAERYRFIREKILAFGKKFNEPVLHWTCPVKIAKNDYDAIPTEAMEHYKQLDRYFARGAPCILTETINTKIGLGKGIEGSYVDAVWTKQNINISELAPGKIHPITQPDYIIIEVKQKQKSITFAIKPTAAQFKDINGKTKGCLQHESVSSGAVTFHKVQGKTMHSTILSLNATSKVSKKIYPVSLPSIYVGCSRVHDHEHLRILPLSQEDKEALKKLKWDPYLPMFFKNWDKTGKWKTNGLKQHRDTFIEKVKINLASITWDSITKTEAQKFVKQLDLIVDSETQYPTITEYKAALQEAYNEGKKILQANNNAILKQQRNKTKQKLQKENLRDIRLTKLRYYAKRLGMTNVTVSNKQTLTQALTHIRRQENTNLVTTPKPKTKRRKLTHTRRNKDKEEMDATSDEETD